MIIKKVCQSKSYQKKYHRDAGTIIGKLKQLNIHKPINNKYSNDDIEFLKIYYPLGDWDSIFKRFPTATKQNIFHLRVSIIFQRIIIIIVNGLKTRLKY